jgi:hypothetical protein
MMGAPSRAPEFQSIRVQAEGQGLGSDPPAQLSYLNSLTADTRRCPTAIREEGRKEKCIRPTYTVQCVRGCVGFCFHTVGGTLIILP